MGQSQCQYNMVSLSAWMCKSRITEDMKQGHGFSPGSHGCAGCAWWMRRGGTGALKGDGKLWNDTELIIFFIIFFHINEWAVLLWEAWNACWSSACLNWLGWSCRLAIMFSVWLCMSASHECTLDIIICVPYMFLHWIVSKYHMQDFALKITKVIFMPQLLL